MANFIWNDRTIQSLLGEIRHRQGKLLGKMESLGFALQEEALLNISRRHPKILRQSSKQRSGFIPLLARHLGMDIPGMVPSDRNTDGVVEMMLDTTQHFNSPLLEKDYLGGRIVCFRPEEAECIKLMSGAEN